MTYNFCTIFNRNYLYKGLTLYYSIIKHCSNFKLWILCLDDTTFTTLRKMNLTNIELVTLNKIEDEKLLSVKRGRNTGEYSWTCKPVFLLFILKNYPDIEIITYLDADLFFFSSPEPIYKELSNNSIMITSHRFPPEKKYREKTKGKYNAGLIIFKNNQTTKDCLELWKKKCLEWCFHRYEEGKLGDQMYLEEWSKLFSGIHDIKQIGVNLGPWSLSQYNVKIKNNQIFINDEPLILFHFHSSKIISFSKFEPSEDYFNLPTRFKKSIYTPYFGELKKVMEKIKIIDNNFHYGFSQQLDFIKKIKQILKNLRQKI